MKYGLPFTIKLSLLNTHITHMFYISWLKVRNVSFTPERNKMAEGGDDLTKCPVCFDEYTETGDPIPKILPSSHSLCEKCLEVLIRNKKIDCPECRVNHEAVSGTRSFPQNKYIVTHLHRHTFTKKRKIQIRHA